MYKLGNKADHRKSFVRTIVYICAGFIYIYVSTSLLIFHGPWKMVTTYVVNSLAITRHAYLLRPLSLYTLSNAEIKQQSVDWTLSPLSAATKVKRDYSYATGTLITYQKVSFPTFSAQIFLVQNPKRVQVAVTRFIGHHGETVEQFAKDTHAVLAVNGGAFNDTGWRGTGGILRGTTIHDGKFITYAPEVPIIGITGKGELICGVYTKSELISWNVEEAVSFGPVLVQDGKGVAPDVLQWAPRVAIGQRRDGTIILS